MANPHSPKPLGARAALHDPLTLSTGPVPAGARLLVAGALLWMGLAPLVSAGRPAVRADRCDIQAPVALRAQVVAGGTSAGHVVVALEHTILREIESAVSLNLTLPAGVTRTQPASEWHRISSAPGTGMTTFILDFQPTSSTLELYFRAASVEGSTSGPPVPSQMLGGATLRVGRDGQFLERMPGTVKPEGAGSRALPADGAAGAPESPGKVLEMPGVMK